MEGESCTDSGVVLATELLVEERWVSGLTTLAMGRRAQEEVRPG